MVTHNLPQYATPFVGRLTEIAEVTNRLNEANCHLLTLVGPGGIGKTRLAAQVALNHRVQFADGVAFVQLQPLNSPDFIVSTIAKAVGYQFYSGLDPVQQLLNFFSEKTLLLVLDNFEHLSEGAGLLSKLVAAAPQVCVLVTSRERLNLVEEWVFEVRELNYPVSETETDIEAYDAVQLFMQHARRVQPAFDLTSLQKPAVIRICRLVGGMPLAIELAATWLRTLSSDEIAREIARSLDILETPMRNIERRHRNIRAAFDPTWNRLSDDERAVFRKLSVFRGGFTRGAAEKIAGADLSALSTLVDRSLIRLDHDGRYDLHELLGQYAEERLREAAGGLEEVCDQHTRYFAALLAQKQNALEGRGQKEAFDEIQREIDNIRAAWQWATEHKREAEIAQACHALWFFYDTRSWYQEGERAFRAAAEALGINEWDEGKSAVLGKIMACYGGFCFSLNWADKARKLLEESLAILRRHHAMAETGFALLRLSEVAMFLENDTLAAQDYLRQSLALFREVGYRWGIAYCLRWLGFAAFILEDYEEGKQLAQQGLAIYRENYDQWGTAIALGVVGFCLLEQGEVAEARRIGHESLALCREIGLQWASLNALIVISRAACALKQYHEARQYLYEALEVAVNAQFAPYILSFAEETVDLTMKMGKKQHGAAILTFLLDYPISPLLGKRRILRLMAQLQDELAPNVLVAAQEQAATLDLDAVVQICFNDLHSIGDNSRILTERELQVLRLIADGFSNRDIAENLIFSVGTVKWYVHQIHSKLGVNSRTQAIARARELHLLP